MTSPDRLRLLAGAAAAAAGLLAPAPAADAYADLESPSIFGDVAYVTQGPAPVELDVWSDMSGHVRFHGNEAIQGAGACTGGPDSGSCPAAGVQDVFVGLNDADNALEASGLQVASVLTRLGGGADRFTGSGQGDIVSAGDGSDHVEGGGGADLLADAGHGILDGGSGSGTDTFSGGEGADVFVQGAAVNTDTIAGGAGRDRIDYSARTTAISVEPEAHTGDGAEGENDGVHGVEDVIAGAGHDTLTGGDAPNHLVGGPGGDVLRGGAGADVLRGGTLTPAAGSGDDVYDGGPGTDQFVPSDGTDTLSYRSQPEGVAVSLDGLPNDGNAFGENAPAGFEIVEGGAGPDTLTGHATNGDELRGLAGGDHLVGGGGGDLLDPGPGADTADGESGDDRVLARDGEADTIACGSGIDVVVADAADAAAPDCETVERAVAPGGGSEPPPPGGGDGETTPPQGGASPGATPRLAIRSGRVARDRRGRVRVRLSCAAGAPCSGALVLRGRHGRVARRAFALAAGETRTVAVRLRGRLPRRLRAAAQVTGGARVTRRLRVRRPPRRGVHARRAVAARAAGTLRA